MTLAHHFSPALGYFLTFHPYGTWLPGDARGWHRHGDQGPHRPPQPRLEAWCREQMAFAPLYFDEGAQALVTRSMEETCARREWVIHALTVQPAHVHIVVTAPEEPGAVTGRLKCWATRSLRSNGLPPERPVWAEHGSTRWLFTARRFATAVGYVVDDHHRR